MLKENNHMRVYISSFKILIRPVCLMYYIGDRKALRKSALGGIYSVYMSMWMDIQTNWEQGNLCLPKRQI